jgi:tetrahydromethanopterin S-methyltransferase subunit A
LGRRDGGQDGWPAIHIQFAQGDAEGLAGEEAATAHIEQTQVMAGVAGGIKAHAEVESVTVGGGEDAVGRHR